MTHDDEFHAASSGAPASDVRCAMFTNGSCSGAPCLRRTEFEDVCPLLSIEREATRGEAIRAR